MEERKVNYLTFGNHLSMYSKVDYSFCVRFHQLNGGSGGEHVRLGPPDLLVAQVVSANNRLLGNSNCQSQARLKPKRCLVGFIFTLEIIIIIKIK